MAGLYFPKKANLTSFSDEQERALRDAVELLRGADLPHGWLSDLGGLAFYSDKGMTPENGVMGMTSFLRSKEVLVAEFLARQITWEASGVPNNEMAMAVVVHELTHLAQRRWLFGLAWLVLNIPGVDRLTLERWAVENQEAAQDFLAGRYREMRQAD